MKQTIIDLLKTKFEGVDESILSRIAETKAAKAVKTEEEANAYVEGITLTHLLNSYGDIRSTEAQRTAVANYEKKHGIKDGKKVSTEGDPNALGNEDNIEEMPAWAKAMLESNKKLTEQVEAMTAEKHTAARKQKLDAIINRLPERDRRGYARTSFADLSDEDFDTLLEDINNEVEDTLKENQTTGTTFRAPFHRQGGGSHKDEATKAEVDAVMSHL